jgi:subtilisin family serine protease
MKLRILALVAGVAATVATSSAAVAAPTGTILSAGTPTAVPGSYIVVLKDGKTLAAPPGVTVARTYGAVLNGFEARMSEPAARRLAADPAVAYVEQNQTVTVTDTQANPPSWGLDRVDQRSLPLQGAYTYPSTAAAVHAYVIDTGIRLSHSAFGGRATSGFDAIDGGTADDCDGHGTHVAGTIGGAQYGVAKEVQLVAVRVLDCGGSGTAAGVIAGINWVTANAIRPAVANMSLGGPTSTALDNAVTDSIDSGVTHVLAAGNSAATACTTSPARTPDAITVGATTRTDARSAFSNFGGCLDLFAPGSGITSAYVTSDTAAATASGTSMASPHVAGAAALLHAANPPQTPPHVAEALHPNATPDVVTSPGTGSPNLLLFLP